MNFEEGRYSKTFIVFAVLVKYDRRIWLTVLRLRVAYGATELRSSDGYRTCLDEGGSDMCYITLHIESFPVI